MDSQTCDHPAVSAGLVPGESVHPLAVRVLEEKGIGTSGLRPKHVCGFLGGVRVATVITVCIKAVETCPTLWPGPVDILQWPVDDPAAVAGTDEERLAAFRATLDSRILEWLGRAQAGLVTKS